MSDAIIIGAGHNGLTCAFYLARKGLKVTILEASDKVGGAAVTDEFLPGFKNSAASYTVSLLQPKVIRDMELERHGLKVVLRKRDNFLPGDGIYLLAGRGGLTRKEIKRLNPADGEGYDRYIAELETVVRLLKKWLLRAPPNVEHASRSRARARARRRAASGRCGTGCSAGALVRAADGDSLRAASRASCGGVGWTQHDCRKWAGRPE